MIDIVIPVIHFLARVHLRAAQNGDHNIPRALTCFGRLSFSVAGPDAWNSLLRVIRCIVVPSISKRRLKAELFSRACDVSLDISDDYTVTYVKRFRIRIGCHPLLFCIYFFYIIYIFIGKHRRPYFVGAQKDLLID